MDFGRIDRFVIGIRTDASGHDTYDWRHYSRDQLVVHPTEVARFEREELGNARPEATPDQPTASPTLLLPLTAPTTAPVNNLPPGQGRVDRRQLLVRILAALRECDPQLREDDMPGTKVDFLRLCQAISKHAFSIEPTSFNGNIKGWLGFRSGARSSTYYQDQLPAIRAKLG
jgi:hypothetical protein